MTQLGSRKSRKGCVRCKTRRVKCDEKAPCTNCTRRAEHCSLSDAQSPSVASEPCERDESLPASQHEYLQDMELWFHYNHSLELVNLGHREDITQLWRDKIPMEALNHPFLLHGLLSLAAIWLCRARPTESNKYLRLFDKHQAIALSQYRSVLAGPLTDNMANALFALASCISITSMARSSLAGAFRSPTPYIEVGDFVELVSLINGVREVVGITREQVAKGPLAPMVLGHSLPSDVETQIQLPASVRTQIEALEHMLNTQCDEARRQSCEVALKALVSIYRNVRHFAKQHAVQSGHLFRWLVELPAEFVRCVKAEYPPSLVILAYFAAAVSGIKSTWYLQEWSLPCLQGIRMVLASNMQTWLDWPQEQAERQFPAIRQDD